MLWILWSYGLIVWSYGLILCPIDPIDLWSDPLSYRSHGLILWILWSYGLIGPIAYLPPPYPVPILYTPSVAWSHAMDPIDLWS
jgi:hypothetical protein